MINGMLYFRGHRKDFDEWEEMGNPGWGWEGVLPFFKSAERWSGPTNPNGTYGTEGRFNIMYSPFRFKVMNYVTREESLYWVALRLVGRDFLENIP